MPTRKGGEKNSTPVGFEGPVEEGPVMLHAVQEAQYTALYMETYVTNLVIISDMITLIIQCIMDENEQLK